MNILKFDLFSSEFQFNIGVKHNKKGTLQDQVLSVVVAVTVLFYFSYLLNQYFNNIIDPKFRSQSFITGDRKDIALSSDLIRFKFLFYMSMTIEQYQELQNKTYIVYQRLFYYQDSKQNIYQTIYLDVVQCTEPPLKGLNCIDFSKVKNYTLSFDSNNQLYLAIYINVYGCLDIDAVKTTIPKNCAQQSEIDSLVNNEQNAYFYLKLKTQQYNTTSRHMQAYYRNIYNILQPEQLLITTLNTQIKQAQVYQGKVLFQQGFGPHNEIIIQMDEIVQQFKIQYPAITEILALVNSVVTLHSNLAQKYKNIFLQAAPSIIQQELVDEVQENQQNQIQIPNFLTKSRDYVERNQLNLFHDENNSNLQNSPNYRNESNGIKDDNIINLCQNSAMSSKNCQSLFILTIVKKISFPQKNILKQKIKRPILNLKKFNVNQNDQLNGLEIKVDEQQLPDTEMKNMVTLNENKEYLTEAISQKFKTLFSNSIKQTLQKQIFKFKFFKSKRQEQQKFIDNQLFTKMGEQVTKCLDVYEFYKDIIFLKKAITMLLTKDQLAAIQLLGLTDNFIELDFKSDKIKIEYLEKKVQLNYFEKQFSILQSQQLQEQYLTKFLMKCQESQNLSSVDQRILTSIIKQRQK
ncbi:hypothetical protein ABPG72_003716 [Tetrahymena utriculariae]